MKPCRRFALSWMPSCASDSAASKRRRPLEVLRVFLKLGLTSFGGPVAHLGYFRNEFVVRRGWLDERAFADLLALCQFLPGPASSQTGFAIGLMRAGYRRRPRGLGRLHAALGDRADPVRLGAGALNGPAGEGLLHGLKLVAVAIVAQAVLGMAQNLAPDRPRAAIAVFALIVTAFAPGGVGQISAIAMGGVLGLVLCRPGAGAAVDGGEAAPVSRRLGLVFLAAFFALLALSFMAGRTGALAFLAAIYRSGALVFGGGHVVLPLLQGAVVAPGFVSESAFLAGYGAAQAVPGPLFTFAAFLGAVANAPPGGAAGAALALIAIFAPGMLILMGALPYLARAAGAAGGARGDGGGQRRGRRPAGLRPL